MRLGDLDALRDDVDTWGCNDYDKYDFLEAIDNAPTIKTYCYFCGQTEHGQIEERPQGEWIRKEDIIHLLESWADGCSYIEIPTDDAIRVIKEFKGGAENG